MNHDELCPLYPDIRPSTPFLSCQCDLIAKACAAERIRLTRDEGWFTDEAHEAVVATAKVRAHRGALDRLRELVFDIQEEAWIEYRGAVPGDVDRVALMCHQIEAFKAVIAIIDKELEEPSI